MKLAEALQERADLNRHIQQLRERLRANAIVQEGEKTAEDPQQLLGDLDAAIAALETLIARINLTNCQTRAGGKNLTQLIAQRDALTLKIGAYRELAAAASQTGSRASRTEIKILSAVKVQEIQKQVDGMARDLRQLDNLIQATNWATELA